MGYKGSPYNITKALDALGVSDATVSLAEQTSSRVRKVYVAFCTSDQCWVSRLLKDNVTKNKVIKYVPRDFRWCPDCHSALLWEEAPRR